MYLFGWMQTVFTKALPLDAAACVWDLFLLEGVPLLFRAALALLDLLGPHLLRGAFEDTVQILTQARGSGRESVARVWAGAVGDPAVLARAIDAVELAPEALLDLEDMASDPFFYRRCCL
jgi:hypothetical protein